MDSKNLNIALVGCGKMGSAMLRGWINAKLINSVISLDPLPLPDEFKEYAPNPISHFKDIEKFSKKLEEVNIVVIAIKPQIMSEVCSKLTTEIPKKTPILSIAAGQTINNFEELFGVDHPIIRAMPNTPASIGKGVSVACANSSTEDGAKQIASDVLSSVGIVEWINDEDLLNAVTAVSGSGPAYVFHFIEALASAGEQAGLSPEFAMLLARNTITGSAALAQEFQNTPASQLRENVTSPGGTTEAALEVLMDGQFQEILTNAIDAAVKRGEKLSQS